MSKWDFIPATFIATVQGSGRIPQVSKELDRVGLTRYQFNYQVPPSEKTFVNITLSCTDNHQQIYRRGLEGGYPFILVLEDDAYFPNPIVDLDKVAAFAATPGWDFFYLGHFPWKIGERIRKYPHVYRSISWCTHAYLISAQGMKKMLVHTPSQMMDIARVGVPAMAQMVFKECGGIDTYIAYQSYLGKLSSFALVPMMIYQYSIPGWKNKADAAQYLSVRVGFWPRFLFLAMWVLIWMVIWVGKKRLLEKGKS